MRKGNLTGKQKHNLKWEKVRKRCIDFRASVRNFNYFMRFSHVRYIKKDSQKIWIAARLSIDPYWSNIYEHGA